nr:PREDICTED: cathepsin B-like [Bemisia tabaci]
MKVVIFFLCISAYVKVSLAEGAYFLSDDFINDINSKQDQWKAGRNFDPNTPEEDIKVRLGAILDGDVKPRVKTFDPNWPAETKIPKNFDARKRWRKQCPRIAEVLDQGKCGSCWAIAVTQAFTDRWCIITKGKHQMRLSTSNLLSCCYFCGFGCGGGFPGMAWLYVQRHGLPSGGNYNTTEGCQPYSIPSPCKYQGDDSPYQPCTPVKETPPCESRCTNSKYSKRLDKDYRYGHDMYVVPDDEKSIMREILAYGPVSTAFGVMDDFPSYKSGVYEPSASAKFLGGHAVKVLGWGVENKVPYWLVMNSWNEYWGDHGLIKIKRNSPRVKLEVACLAAVPNTKKKSTEDMEDPEAVADSSVESLNEDEEV